METLQLQLAPSRRRVSKLDDRWNAIIYLYALVSKMARFSPIPYLKVSSQCCTVTLPRIEFSYGGIYHLVPPRLPTSRASLSFSLSLSLSNITLRDVGLVLLRASARPNGVPENFSREERASPRELSCRAVGRVLRQCGQLL